MKGAAEFRVAGSGERSSRAPVFVVDLDGTLVRTNLLLECLLALMKQKIWRLFSVPIWLLKGKAYLKQQVARRVSLDASLLPYREELVDYLKAQRAAGRSIVLATASDTQIARQVANHLRLFDLVLASDGVTNLSGESKRDRLVNEFGNKGFDYAGNERRDLAVWSSARKAVVVNPDSLVRSSVETVAQVDRVFADRRKGLLEYLESLRLRHWIKNLLVFVPLLAAHRFGDLTLFGEAILAFLAFGCFASGSYVINDLLDLSEDRRHPQKRFRAFACGDLPLSYALAMIPALIGLGCLFGILVSPPLLGVLFGYFALTLTYSLRVRRVAVLDVIFLAGLYAMRIMAGSASVGIWPSHWLLALSTFLFLSLALVKRYSELVIMRSIDGDGAKARGYKLSDSELLAAMGVASGYLAVLVLALYVDSDTARHLYRRYEVMWALCPLLLYWISHVWLIAHRGRMPDDPVVFAMHNRLSLILILLMVVIFLLAL